MILEAKSEAICVGCGCSESNPCPSGCYWVAGPFRALGPIRKRWGWCSVCHESDPSTSRRRCLVGLRVYIHQHSEEPTK